MTVAAFSTLDGRMHDLLQPDPAEIRFGTIAESLAKICRFAGHVPGFHYSVAQHCLIGAEALRAEGIPDRIARLFLLHDAHEAFIGDITTPVLRALIDIGGERTHVALVHLKASWDAAIYLAAGVALDDDLIDLQDVIDNMDERLLITEMMQLRSLKVAPPDFRPVKMTGRIKPLSWEAAARQWLSAVSTHFPDARI